MDFTELLLVLEGLKPPVVVGVSGGPDSLCLLHGLLGQGWEIVPVYFDHQIRPDSGEEAGRLSAQLEEWGLTLVIGRGDVPAAASREGASLEEAGRKLRYRFLFQTAEQTQAGAVLVGHHADDQVETMLMHLLRGSGLSGLTGMERFSLPNPWSGTIPLVRPLLKVWQEEILHYCDQHDLQYFIDPTNRDPNFLRNKIRQELIPILESYQPGVKNRILQTVHILQEDQKVLVELEDRTWEDLRPEHGTGWIAFELTGLLEQPIGLQCRLVRKAFLKLKPGGSDLGFRHLTRAVEFLKSGQYGRPLEMVNLVTLEVRGGQVYLAEEGAELPPGKYPQLPAGEVYTMHLPGEFSLGDQWMLKAVVRDLEELREGEGVVDRDPYRAVIDRRTIGDQLEAAGRRPGERIRPLGMRTGSVKLADLMINEQVPAFARENWPVIRKDGQVIWIPGLRLADSVRVTEDTAQVIVLTLVRRSPAHP
jgi:tRNA(Ile)-lysidine synthase